MGNNGYRGRLCYISNIAVVFHNGDTQDSSDRSECRSMWKHVCSVIPWLLGVEGVWKTRKKSQLGLLRDLADV